MSRTRRWLIVPGALLLALGCYGSVAERPRRPYEGRGVTAAWHVGTKLFVVSGDKMWAHDGARWTSSGPVEDQPGWGTAPLTSCAE